MPGKECEGWRFERGAGQPTDVQARHPPGAAGEERGGPDPARHHRGQPGQPGRVPAHRVEEGVRLPQEGHPQDGAVPLKTTRVIHVLWPNHHGVKRPGKFKLPLQTIEDLDHFILQVSSWQCYDNLLLLCLVFLLTEIKGVVSGWWSEEKLCLLYLKFDWSTVFFAPNQTHPASYLEENCFCWKLTIPIFQLAVSDHRNDLHRHLHRLPPGYRVLLPVQQ